MAAVCVFCASQTVDARYLDLARDVGTQLAARGHALVSGGGRVSMMGAVAAATRAAGGYTVGVMPQLLVDREIADTASDELIVTTDMATRKIAMCEKADAFLTLPGGLGTLDELFEVWTTRTLGQHRKPLVILDADGFYTELVGWLRRLPDQGLATRDAIDLLQVATTVGDALDRIEAALA